MKNTRLLLTMLFLFIGSVYASAQVITGTVKDNKGEAIIGATVIERGTNNGTTTGAGGKFSLKVAGDKTLEVSYLGMEKQIIPIKGRTTIDVVLEEDATAMDEIVVIGYGTVRKRDLTGAVSSVKQDLIKMTPASNPMEALQGRVAGLDITKTSGQAGQGVNLQLRGNRSITASGNPLFIIDGMPGDYSTLNPNDIESIDVLKDAASTAVYGSAGSNGVIIITTKKGQIGKTSVNFDAYYGFNGWSTLPKMNSGQQWVDTRILARKEGGIWEDEDQADFDKYLQAFQRGEVIDWADALLRTGYVQNYSLSVSGGTQKTQAYFSLNYSKENGQYKNDEYKLYSTNIRINHEVNKWFSAGLHSQISYSNQEKTSSKLDNAMRANPFGKLYKEDGSINEYPVEGNNKQVNLLLNQDRNVYRDNPNKLKLYIQPYIRISPIKGLMLESRLSTDLSYSTANKFIGYGSYQFYDAAGTGALNLPKEQLANYTSASVTNNRGWGYTWENILTYNFNINKDHEFTVTGVATYSDSQSDKSVASAVGITSNEYYWTNMKAAVGNRTVESSYSMGKSMGYVGRLNYSFMSKYLLSASIRYDGNSKLAKDVRWSTFPAVSAGWRISEERFMDFSRGWLDNLKLRAGYGETGAAGISAYDSWAVLDQGLFGLGDMQTTKYTFSKYLSNSRLTWERSKNTNIGLDFSLFNNRIDVSAEYYITNTDGVIWKQNVPIINGGFSATDPFQINKNIAKTKNKGFELSLNTRNIVTKDFMWSSTLTYSVNKEKVVSLGAGAADFITNGDYTLHIGDAIKSYRDYKIAGVWQYGEEADAAAFGRKPGDLKVSVPNMRKVSDGVWEKGYLQEDGSMAYNTYDANTPYAVNADDKQMIGHNTPSWSLGFQNTFTWKAFDLSVYMYARFGQMFYYDPVTWFSSSGGAFPSHFNYWTKTNPSNDFPALDASRDWSKDPYYTALAYVDGSFFKIKNITLGYTLPQRICSKIHISNLRVYATMTNPLVVAKDDMLKNYDPEMNGSLDFPLTKQVVIGLNFSF